MYYYKFRVFYDDVEDFVRDIEILSHDNFESFHQILYSSIGLQGNELASFFICDTKWNKQKEVTLIDMGDETVSSLPEYEDNDDFSTKSNLPKSVMKNSILKDLITDPHQHIIYEYDFLNPKNFYIELMKILPIQGGIVYPRCTYKMKEMPKEITPIDIPNPEDEYLEDMGDDAGDDFQDGYNDDDQLNMNSMDVFGGEF